MENKINIRDNWLKTQIKTCKFLADINVLELICVSLYTEFWIDLCKKFQVASVCDINVEYQILC